MRFIFVFNFEFENYWHIKTDKEQQNQNWTAITDKDHKIMIRESQI